MDLYGSVLASLSLLATGTGHGTTFRCCCPRHGLAPSAALPGSSGRRCCGHIWVVASGVPQREDAQLTRVLVLLHYASGLALVATASGKLAHLQFGLRISPEFMVVWGDCVSWADGVVATDTQAGLA